MIYQETRLATCVEIGPSHKLRDLPCQDFSVVEYLEGGAVVGVLADGAGSALLGHVGAEKVCEFGLDCLRSHTELTDALATGEEAEPVVQELLVGCFTQIEKRLREYADYTQRNLRDLASTLVMFIATPDYLASVEVGDSLLISRRKGQDTFDLVSLPTRGDYVNQTVFVTHEPKDEQIKCNVSFYTKEEPLEFVGAISDGLECVAIDRVNWKPGGRFFEPIVKACELAKDNEELKGYLGEVLRMDALAKRSDDDKGLLVVLFGGISLGV